MQLRRGNRTAVWKKLTKRDQETPSSSYIKSSSSMLQIGMSGIGGHNLVDLNFKFPIGLDKLALLDSPKCFFFNQTCPYHLFIQNKNMARWKQQGPFSKCNLSMLLPLFSMGWRAMSSISCLCWSEITVLVICSAQVSFNRYRITLPLSLFLSLSNTISSQSPATLIKNKSYI